MFKKLSVVFISIFICSNVFSAQVFQTLSPNEGQSEFTPMLGLSGGSATSKFNSDIKYRIAYGSLGVSYYYGIATGQAIGLEANYGVQSTTTSGGGVAYTTKFSGLTNPTLKYKALFELGVVTAFVHVGYRFNVTKETYNLDDREGNLASGQNSFLLNTGVYGSVNPDLIMGGFINYDHRADGNRTETSFGSETVYKYLDGGSLLVSAFLELQNNEYHPNVALGYKQAYSGKKEDPNGNKTTTDGINLIVASGSARFQVQPNLSINPEIIIIRAQENDFLKDYSTTAVAVSGRFLF